MALGILNRFRAVKESGKLRLLSGSVLSNTVEAISYKDALKRISNLRDILINKPIGLVDRSKSAWFWLTIYILALYAQERMIESMNDELIASDIPWDSKADFPLISSTAGDVVSYAERLKDPKDHFLKALLLSFSGWTLLSTEKKECACGKGKLQEIPVDVFICTQVQMNSSLDRLGVRFFVGVQSDDVDHLEHHYSFKQQSVRHDNLVIIYSSNGEIFKDKEDVYRVQCSNSNQAEQFRANRMAEILDGLVGSFSGVAG
jgi:hypothetical protein